MIGNSNYYLLSTTTFEALTYFEGQGIATGTFGWNRMRLDEPVTVSFTRSTVTNNKGYKLL